MKTDNFKDKIKSSLGDGSYLMAVPALKGHMGGVDYYVITLPFSVMSRYVTTTDRNLPAQQRENRTPRESRFKAISKYIRDNPETYRFSSITCTYGKDGTKKPIDWDPVTKEGDLANIGVLTIDQRDPLIIVDGQHRFKGIEKAIEAEPELGDEMISIVLFPYKDLRSAQQLFSDLNRNAKKTTKSLDILFDRRDIYNRVLQQLVNKVSVFRNHVNLEDAGIPAQSSDVFTLSGIYQATDPIIKAINEASFISEELTNVPGVDTADLEKRYADFLADVWEFIAAQFPEWSKAVNGELDIRVVRSKYLHWNSGVISAVGQVVASAMKEKGKDWRKAMKTALGHPDNLGWRRAESHWQGLVTAGTLVLPRSVVAPQLRAYLKKLAGLTLTEGDKENLEIIEKRKKELKAL